MSLPHKAHPTRSVLALLIVAALMTSGCALGRVKLTAPAPSASFEERSLAYERLRPVAKHIRVEHSDVGTFTHESLELADGTKVRNTKDFLPVLPPDSVTARAIQQQHYHMNRFSLLAPLGLLGTAAGGFGAAVAFGDSGEIGGRYLGWKLGGITLAAASIVAIVFGVRHLSRSNKAQAKVFKNYERDLQRRLQIEVTRAEPSF